MRPPARGVLARAVVVFFFLLATAAGCLPRAAATSAPPRTVLVELFTSQGCSSCPAADAFVAELPSLGLPRARVVPLTFHVDYWNGLGWPDPFSSPAFTARQQRYVDAGSLRGPEGQEGLTGLYTPQMIVDGRVHFSGHRRDVALAEIRRAAAAPPVVDLAAAATVDGDRAVVTARVTPAARAAPGLDDLRLFVAVAARAARTKVTGGENGGETLDEAAVVRALSPAVPLSLAPGAPPVRVTVSRPSDLPWSALELAVVVQSTKTLHVAAAQSVTLTPGEPLRGEPR
jgi:hypothetical protein